MWGIHEVALLELGGVMQTRVGNPIMHCIFQPGLSLIDLHSTKGKHSISTSQAVSGVYQLGPSNQRRAKMRGCSWMLELSMLDIRSAALASHGGCLQVHYGACWRLDVGQGT